MKRLIFLLLFLPLLSYGQYNRNTLLNRNAAVTTSGTLFGKNFTINNWSASPNGQAYQFKSVLDSIASSMVYLTMDRDQTVTGNFNFNFGTSGNPIAGFNAYGPINLQYVGGHADGPARLTFSGFSGELGFGSVASVGVGPAGITNTTSRGFNVVADSISLSTDGTHQLSIDNTGVWKVSGYDVGTAGQILTIDAGGLPKWEDFSGSVVPSTRTINGIDLSANRVIPGGVMSVINSGSWYSGAITQTTFTTGTLAANTLRAYPILIGRACSFDEIKIEVTTGVGSTTARVAIYADNGSGYPGTLVANSDPGTFDTSSIAVVTSGTLGSPISIAQPGLYWYAVNSNGAATVRIHTASSVPAVRGARNNISSSGQPGGWSVAQAYGAMPGTFPGGAADLNATGPVVIFHVP